MFWNVSGLLKSSVGDVREYIETEDVSTIGDEAQAVEPLTGRVRLTRTNQGILVDANLHTRVRLACSRCLEDTEEDIDIAFSEEFLSTVDVNTGAPTPVDDPDAFTIDKTQTLDLSEATRQYGLVEISLYPLCRPDCAGLCPMCGRNRNEGECNCETESGDARLAKLRLLLDGVPIDIEEATNSVN
jgi:uncharacterized protein